MPRDIIIDTDPGVDDAVAILLALASPELDVLGLVAVCGNAPLAICERNARCLCALAGRTDVPVHAGCPAPMRRKLRTAPEIHGAGGLGGLRLPDPIAATREAHGVDFLIETTRRAPTGTVTWCALGPLTNIAGALTRAPELAARLGGLVIMGGAATVPGNVTPVAEFNFHVDPHAAAIVFASGAPTTMVPLDVTRHLRATRPRAARLRALGTRAGEAVGELLRPMPPSRRPHTLHDAAVIAWLIAPDLFRGRRSHVVIETHGALTTGMSVVDRRPGRARPANALVLENVDATGFYDLLTERLARLP
jgi:purine nucleosidase